MSIYDVTINAAGLGGAAPADGFIDSKNSFNYMNESSTAPSSAANGKAKARAFARYRLLILNLTRMTNVGIVSVTPTGGGANSASTVLTLRLEIQKDDSYLVTPDEDNAGVTLTGIAAIKRACARAMTATQSNKTIEFYDPTVVAGRQIDGSANAGRARGSSIVVDNIGPLTSSTATAEAAVTVTKIS